MDTGLVSLGYFLKMEGKPLGDRVRKVRSDKKFDCKPFVKNSLYESISRIGYVTDRPVKEVGEFLIKQALESSEILDCYEELFVRDFWFGDTVYMGNGRIGMSKQIFKINGAKRRLNLRVSENVYNSLKTFAHAVDSSAAGAASSLIETAFLNSNVIHRYIETYVVATLDPNRRKQLKEVLVYINQNNPKTDQISLLWLIDLIAENFMRGAKNMQSAIQDFLDKHST